MNDITNFIFVAKDFNGDKEFAAGVAQGGNNEKSIFVAIKNNPQRACSQAAKMLRRLARKFDILSLMDSPLDALVQDKVNSLSGGKCGEK